MMRFCSLGKAAQITSEILLPNLFPILCIVGKEKAVCLLLSLSVAWSLTRHKSPAVENSAVCSLMPTLQEGTHSSSCPQHQCLAERWMKSFFFQFCYHLLIKYDEKKN